MDDLDIGWAVFVELLEDFVAWRIEGVRGDGDTSLVARQAEFLVILRLGVIVVVDWGIEIRERAVVEDGE